MFKASVFANIILYCFSINSYKVDRLSFEKKRALWGCKYVCMCVRARACVPACLRACGFQGSHLVKVDCSALILITSVWRTWQFARGSNTRFRHLLSCFFRWKPWFSPREVRMGFVIDRNVTEHDLLRMLQPSCASRHLLFIRVHLRLQAHVHSLMPLPSFSLTSFEAVSSKFVWSCAC